MPEARRSNRQVVDVQLTREADYAVRCVMEVARRGPMNAAEVARRQEISPTFLGKIVSLLAKAGILTTRRGVGGGIALARSPRSLTLLQVVEAAQGPFAINRCLASADICERRSSCPIHPIWRKAQKDLRAALDITIADILEGGPSA